LKLPQGEVHDFSGEEQKLSGEVQNDLRREVHTSPQNPAMHVTVYFFMYIIQGV
jgi:hypothetical protein